MSEDTMIIEAEQVPQKEKPSAVIRGVQMPAHQVREAIAANVAAEKITEEEGEVIFWLYAYGQEYHLNYDELGKAAELSAATVYGLFHGNYKAENWSGAIASIARCKRIKEEEAKRKSIGFVETETAKIIHNACRSAMNDGMPAFIYGASQLGKTTALLEFQRRNNHGRTRYIRLGSRWTKGRLVRELARMLGNGVKASKSWVLEDAIFGGLNRYNLLIIDEFHLAIETATDEQAKAMVEFIREIYDRTGCGLVISSTKVGLTALETGRNQMLFDQLKRRGVVKVVLPDVPKVKDINDFARSFDLPIPSGALLADIKQLLKTRGLGVFVKYLQKAYAIASSAKRELTWNDFNAVAAGYAQLERLKNDY